MEVPSAVVSTDMMPTTTMPFPPDASYASSFMSSMAHQQRHKVDGTGGGGGVGYAVPQVSRVLQLDSQRIDTSLHSIIERLSLGVFEVEGGGGSGLVEFADVSGGEASYSLLGLGGETNDRIGATLGEEDVTTRTSLQSKWTTLVTSTIPLFRTGYQEELVLLLKAILFKYSVWDRHATLGDRTQNLCFRSEVAVWYEYWCSRWSVTLPTISGSGGDGMSHAATITPSLLPSSSPAPLAFSQKVLGTVLSWGNTVLGITPHGLPTSEPAALVDVPNYRPSKMLKVAYAVISLLFPYLYGRLRRRVTQARFEVRDYDGDRDPLVVARSERSRKKWETVLRVLEKGEKVWAASEYLNFLLFLSFGRFRTLLDRVLGLRLVLGNQKMTPFVAMQLMNEEIINHAWFEFLTFAGSIASGMASKGSRLDRMVLRPARRALGATATVMGVDAMFGFDRHQQQSGGGGSGVSGGPQGEGRQELLRSRCALCNVSPIAIPRLSSTCPHAFCYYCAEVAMRRAGGTTLPTPPVDPAHSAILMEEDEDPFFRCPACGEEVRKVVPLERVQRD